MRWRPLGRGPAESSVEAWRTALKAAFFVGGNDGERAFAWAAGSRNRELRSTVAYSLYFQWRRDPASVYRILDALAHRIGRFPVGRSSRILKTLSDTSITIYINHPERKELAARTSELWADVLKRRLRLHRRRWLEPAAFALLSTVFSRRILETALLDQDPELFFGAREDVRARFGRVAPLADPEVPIDREAVEDLAVLFESPVRLHNVAAALAVAVHAASDAEATAPLVREVHGRVNEHGRLWLLQAFAVLLSDTPESWMPLVEDLTRHLVEHDRETFLTRDGGELEDFDIALLPLGLAYAKSPEVAGMPYLDDSLRRAVDERDSRLLCRMVDGLAPVGFHHPEVVFRSLRPVMSALLKEPVTRRSVASTLADMRTVWFDEVDLFLRSTGAGVELRRDVASITNIARIRRLVNRVGLYNNAVHQALHYPKMRETLLVGGLQELAAASSPRQFLRCYTRPVLDLLHESDFELIRWTTADEG